MCVCVCVWMHTSDYIEWPKKVIAQSAGAVEYTDCTSAEG